MSDIFEINSVPRIARDLNIMDIIPLAHLFVVNIEAEISKLSKNFIVKEVKQESYAPYYSLDMNMEGKNIQVILGSDLAINSSVVFFKWRGQKMAKLTAEKRNKVPKSEFGLPGSEKYPMPDKSHAANAKARATQMVKVGKLSPASKAKIDAKANNVLGKSKGK